MRELLKLKPRARVEFWTDRKYFKNVSKILVETDTQIKTRRILAGKFHRYAGWSFADYFRNFDVTLKDLVWGNLVGFCGFVGGFCQSLARLLPKKTRPEVIFCKGGFVCLPVGLAANLLKIPYIVHESDAVPGLANRILMKKARVVATGFAVEGDDARIEQVGIPVSEEFKPVSAAKQQALKKAFGFDAEKPLVVVTGGSQGAEHINAAMRTILPEMLEFASVGLVAGRKHYEKMVDLKKYEEWDKAKLRSNFRLWEFCTVMNELMGAADVVVSRAGATTIAELAALKKAVVLVPYERLPGGHQVKNAEKLAELAAARVILDAKMAEKPELLLKEVRNLVAKPADREELAKKIHEQARPEAAKHLAEIIIRVATDESR